MIARHQELNPALAGEDATLLAIAGGLVLWLLRLSLAPASTLAGFRAWVLAECPLAPGRRAPRPAPATIPPQAAAIRSQTAATSPHPVTSPQPGTEPPRAAAVRPRGSGPRAGTKTARFLALAADRHGPLAAIPLGAVGQISAALAPQAGLHTGSARAALRRAILAAQEADPR